MNDEVLRKLEEEIQESLDELCKLQVGSEEYERVFKDIKALQELKEQALLSDSKLDLEARKQELAERSALAESEEKKDAEKTARLGHWVTLVKAGMIAAGTVFCTAMTVNAEKTQVVTSRCVELVSKAKNLFER